MKIVKGKLREISVNEYEDIKSIIRIKRCHVDGVELLLEYLGLEKNYENKHIASNILSAIEYNYKYFKIV